MDNLLCNPAHKDVLHILAEVVWTISIRHVPFSSPGEALGPAAARVELVVGEVHGVTDGVAGHLAIL